MNTPGRQLSIVPNTAHWVQRSPRPQPSLPRALLFPQGRSHRAAVLRAEFSGDQSSGCLQVIKYIGNFCVFHCTVRHILKKRADAFFFLCIIIRDSLDNSDIMRYKRLEIIWYAILHVDIQILSLKKTISVLLNLRSWKLFLYFSTSISIADHLQPANSPAPLLLETAARMSPFWQVCSGCEVRDTSTQGAWMLTPMEGGCSVFAR